MNACLAGLLPAYEIDRQVCPYGQFSIDCRRETSGVRRISDSLPGGGCMPHTTLLSQSS
jgi:hypothetical protein